MADDGNQQVWIALALLVGAVLFWVIESGVSGGIFGWIGLLMFLVGLGLLIGAGSGGGSGQQQQQQVVVIHRKKGQGGSAGGSGPKTTQLVRCPKCKQLNSATSRFCGQCGTGLGKA